METYVSRKGKPGLLIDGYRYRKDRDTQSTSMWRCTKAKCQSSCSTRDGEIVRQPTEHNHEREPQNVVDRHVARGAIKRKAIEDLYEQPGKIVCSEAAKHKSLTEADAKLLRDSVYAARLQKRPPLPKSLQDTISSLNLFKMEPDALELEAKQIIQSDPESDIVLLSSPDNLRLLSQSNHIFGDGTFKTAPQHFYRLYILHAFSNGVYVPCVFFLLPDKKQKTYEQMLHHLISSCANFNLTINPEAIHLDSEKAMHTAVKEIWPQVSIISIKGCQFHLNEPWHREIQSTIQRYGFRMWNMAQALFWFACSSSSD
ncbi:uncharacterized protein LOC101848779 isoform X1 [Aplysia californica]|uniref:Uncharacterized protein LOC101848779 isoform X1 n=1 Tax=Aplysia californica TaxID=6500 RepID=A0ABM1W119_APLCA|nr:uncharacterized protein LOC101848779 isoform X1 [Aplysia californica]